MVGKIPLASETTTAVLMVRVALDLYLLKTGLGILDFYHSDWLNGARLSAHIPAVTIYG